MLRTKKEILDDVKSVIPEKDLVIIAAFAKSLQEFPEKEQRKFLTLLAEIHDEIKPK